MRRYLLFLFVGFLSTGCGLTGSDPAGPDLSLSIDTVGAARLVDDLDRWPNDQLEFEEIRVVGDTLVAKVSYGGGCVDHEFALVFAHLFLESYPVQMRGLLSHDAKGDPCRALITRTLRYDLTPLKEAYRQESGTIVLGGNWPEAVRYDF